MIKRILGTLLVLGALPGWLPAQETKPSTPPSTVQTPTNPTVIKIPVYLVNVPLTVTRVYVSSSPLVESVHVPPTLWLAMKRPSVTGAAVTTRLASTLSETPIGDVPLAAPPRVVFVAVAARLSVTGPSVVPVKTAVEFGDEVAPCARPVPLELLSVPKEPLPLAIEAPKV